VLPWVRARLPYRYWRKVVAAIQGVVLTVAAADVAPQAPTSVALTVALALLAESFGRDLVWLWHHRSDDGADVTAVAERGGLPLR
jgi:surface antigen